ncbi:Zinc finger CCCH domain-containing protein 54 [Abeliophyllum distichum]|uniref:Zinc finger CCCH domain-containing protein 54 n=1 Tax=Abeliophyllum distichum TaxID=126358 RepID=A0ABD1UPQ5_9LAMI
MSNSSSRYNEPRSSVLQKTSLDLINEFHDLLDEALYESDQFRMYGFKIKPCLRSGCNSWISCPFLHRGERARRRDPRQFNYVGIPCPDHRYGICWRGDFCLFTHGVFEYWLHPAKYRTRRCNAGPLCTRRVCFFAHSQQELRPETLYSWYYVRGPGQWQWQLQLQPYIRVAAGGAFSSVAGIFAHYVP